MPNKSLIPSIFIALIWISNLFGTDSETDGWAPDFLIIGAQKSGTTMLCRFIRKHPLIIGSEKPEVHFFDVNFHLGLGWYKNQFKSKPNPECIMGEKSPYYLFHPLTAERVCQFFPKIKLIIILRNPIDRTYSHYWFNVRRNLEYLSFEEALAAEPIRLAGEAEKIINDPTYNSTEHRGFSYMARSRYVEQMENWLLFFPREQMFIISSNDLRKKPEVVMEQLFTFLGVPNSRPSSGYTDSHSSYPPMDPELKNQLQEYFRPYNQELEELLGISFGWD